MKLLLQIITLMLSVSSVFAQHNEQIEKSGDILEYLMPACAGVSTLIWRDDTRPTLQFAKTVGVAVGTAYILKKTVKKKRPDFDEYDPRYDSFPSGHTTSAFMSAAFMERRYGWKVGVPAYIVASYVGWTRVYSNRHDWWDVLGGAVVGTASSYLFTKAYQKENLDMALSLAPQNVQMGLTYRF